MLKQTRYRQVVISLCPTNNPSQTHDLSYFGQSAQSVMHQVGMIYENVGLYGLRSRYKNDLHLITSNQTLCFSYII